MRAIVVGAGKVGFQVARMLANEGHDVVVIDHNEKALREIENNLDVLTIHGNGASPAVLNEAQPKGASLFLAVTDVDEVNIVACVAAKASGVAKTVARVRNPEYQGLKTGVLSYKQLGIDLVINPEEAVAYDIVKLLRAPAATEVEYFAEGKLKLLGFRVHEGSPAAGKTIKEANITSCTVATVLRGNEALIPSGGTLLLPGDTVLVIGKTGVPADLGWLVSNKEQVSRTIAIAGGGMIGYRLAQLLEKQQRAGLSVKIIERDPLTCERLSQALGHTLVLNGDATRPEVLDEENVDKVDAFVVTVGNDPTNLLTGFMAKQRGATRVIAELDSDAYVTVAAQMGIDATVVPRMIVASTILRLIRKSNVVSLTYLQSGDLEAVEMVLPRGCPACGKPLKRLGMPAEMVIGAVVRGDTVVIPRGDTVLEEGDHAVIFASPSAAPWLTDSFGAKERPPRLNGNRLWKADSH